MRTNVRPNSDKYFIIMVAVVAAFLLSFAYAQARTREARRTAYGDGSGYTAPAGSGGGGCACCGGGSSTRIEKETTVEGGVQKITVDTSSGSFVPDTIRAKAGIPVEIAFTRAPGGCLAGVLFPDFDIAEDLTAGGKTVKLPALPQGEYAFACQMRMIGGRIVVE